MFDISKKKHKTKNNKTNHSRFVLIKTKGSKKWLNVEKKGKKRRLKKEEEDKLNFF